MNNLFKILYLTVFLCFIFSSNVVGQKTSGIKFSNEATIKADVEAAPCDRNTRQEAVRKIFRSKGAADKDIVVEKFEGAENLVVTKKGKTDETIIVSAHYDEKGGGCGAIDNWTGIVIIANLYATMRDLTTQKTYKFVAFDQEEQGHVGSDGMANAIPKEKRAMYCAMVNLDSFGFTYPQAMKGVSTNKLVSLAGKTAKEMKMPFGKAKISFDRTDSVSFKNRKIPAISFHGLDSRWRDYLHSSTDIVKNVNIGSVYFGYRFSLTFLARIEASKCDAFR